MQELKEPVILSGISASLIAAPRPETYEELVARGALKPREPSEALELFRPFHYDVIDREASQILDWKLQMYISGPDARYNGALGFVTSSEHPEFLRSLNLGLQKVEALEEKSFLGEFRTAVPFCGRIRLEVVANGGRVRFEIVLVSSTGYAWRASFSREQLCEVISTVESLSARGEMLVRTLAELI